MICAASAIATRPGGLTGCPSIKLETAGEFKAIASACGSGGAIPKRAARPDREDDRRPTRYGRVPDRDAERSSQMSNRAEPPRSISEDGGAAAVEASESSDAPGSHGPMPFRRYSLIATAGLVPLVLMVVALVVSPVRGAAPRAARSSRTRRSSTTSCSTTSSRRSRTTSGGSGLGRDLCGEGRGESFRSCRRPSRPAIRPMAVSCCTGASSWLSDAAADHWLAGI